MLPKHLQRRSLAISGPFFLFIFLSVFVVGMLAEGHCVRYSVSEVTFWMQSLLTSRTHLTKGKSGVF